MSITKMKIRFYTIADFIEEESWLREEHRKGWKLKKMVPPCFYTFEECTPEDVIYRLDFKNGDESGEYMQMMQDYGWEYAGKCLGWLYFRKKTTEIQNVNDGELFSDNDSRRERLNKIVKMRLLPLTIIFCCCVVPNAMRAADNGLNAFFTFFWLIMLGIYVFLLVHCGLKLRKMKRELE